MTPHRLEIHNLREHPNASREAAALHARLLPTSPAALLGESFLRDIYYGCLVRTDLVSAFIAYVDGTVAGFIIATSRPADFMSVGFMRHPFGIGWSLLRACAHKPVRLRGLWYAAKLNASRRGESVADTGELLSFGVAEQFRRPAFVRTSGLLVGARLLDAALSCLREHGSQRVRAIVDSDNFPAQLFYRGAGWQLGNPKVTGWDVPTREFLTEL